MEKKVKIAQIYSWTVNFNLKHSHQNEGEENRNLSLGSITLKDMKGLTRTPMLKYLPFISSYLIAIIELSFSEISS